MLFAVGFLSLDGVLLLFAGLWGHARGPVLGGLACFAGALLAYRLWCRHRRAVAELAQARIALQEEARALRELIRKGAL